MVRKVLVVSLADAIDHLLQGQEVILGLVCAFCARERGEESEAISRAIRATESEKVRRVAERAAGPDWPNDQSASGRMKDRTF